MSVYLKHVRNRVLVKGVERSGKVWLGEPIEETRQEYANARIQYWQRPGMNPSWITLLAAFRMYGELYDRGARLRDEQMEGAA